MNNGGGYETRRGWLAWTFLYEVRAMPRPSTRWLCPLLLFASTARAEPAVDLEVGRAALAIGDLEAAQAAFERAASSRKGREAATAGLSWPF